MSTYDVQLTGSLGKVQVEVDCPQVFVEGICSHGYRCIDRCSFSQATGSRKGVENIKARSNMWMNGLSLVHGVSLLYLPWVQSRGRSYGLILSTDQIQCSRAPSQLHSSEAKQTLASRARLSRAREKTDRELPLLSTSPTRTVSISTSHPMTSS